ncbi:MAG: hypothetical protein Q7R59_00950 [bacterium]|nr:hypothetical protein [bacterium]
MKILSALFIAIVIGIGYIVSFDEIGTDTFNFTYEIGGVRYKEMHDAREWNRPAIFLNAWRYTALHNDNALASGGRASKIVDIQYCQYQKPCVNWMLDGLRS